MDLYEGAERLHRGGIPLYERLGGKKAITAVVDEFVTNVAADARINKFFALTASDPKRMAAFKGNLVDQICQAGGGPCTYAGKSMKQAADVLHVSARTIAFHKYQMMQDLGLKSTAGLIQYAIRSHVIAA